MGSVGHLFDGPAVSTPSNSKADLVPYLHLSQGHGGVYALPFYKHGGVEVECIGTHSCWTCVCVYVRLDKERCFVAHIDGHTRAYKEDLDWIPEGPDQVDSLKAHVKDSIRTVVPDPFKNKSSAEMEEIKRSIIIVCPRMSTAHPVTGKKANATGSAIVKAIREYFDVAKPTQPEELAHGFVMNHKTQKLTKLFWDQDVQPTAEWLLGMEKAMGKPFNKRTAEDHEFVKKRPQMLSPESQGFCEVPGRPWTLVYDYQDYDWRKMRLSDFPPFDPPFNPHNQQAKKQDETVPIRLTAEATRK